MTALPHTIDIHAEPVADIATRNVVTLTLEDELGRAAAIMAKRRISSILVVEPSGRPAGIVTERNILHAMQAGTAPAIPVRSVMSAPIISIPETLACQEAYLLCLREGIRHLALTDAGGKLSGVVSETDFRLHMQLTALTGRRQVTAVMSRAVLSRPPGADLRETFAVMEQHRDSCVVAVEDGRPVGIITERDIVRLYAHDGRSGALTVADVMVSPVLTITAGATVGDAAQRMFEARVRHLVVTDPDGVLAGLISEHDLTQTMARDLIDAGMDAERAFLRALVDAIPDLLWLKDPNGVYLACNPRFEHFFGAREADILGRTDHDFVDPGLAEHYREQDRRAIAHGSPLVDRAWGVFAGDGHRELLETVRTPMRDASGRIVGVLGIGRDVTAAYQTQEALRLSEEKLRTLIEAIPDAVQFKDIEGRWLAYNRTAAEMFGLGDIDCHGRTDMELAEIALDGCREGLRKFQHNDRAALRGGRLVRTEESFPDGTGGTRHFDIAKVPLADAEGGRKGLVVLTRDVTEGKRNEASLRLAASVFTSTHEGIIITDAKAAIVEVNEAFTRITGYRREEVIGRNPSLLKSGHQDATFYRGMWQNLGETGHWCGEVWNRDREGRVFAEHLTISAVRDGRGEVSHYVGVFADITDLKEHEQRLERIAHYDALTGVPNRVLLADRMAQAIAQSLRSGSLLAVCYLDLDGFKPVNDRYGHEAGDRLLVEMSQRMKACLRGGDSIARIGGDEFVLLLMGLNRMEECENALRRLLDAIALPVDLDGGSVVLSASLGVTLFPEDDADPDTLLRHADQAMYKAKELGKNRYHLFDPEHDRRIRARFEQLQRLGEALENGEFELHYQPKVNMSSGEILGAEALIRWRHPERGLLPPGDFLPMLKGTTLETALGEWVIDTVLGQIAAWLAAALRLKVSVNIGADHLLKEDFSERLGALLRRHPEAPPDCLELEILESAAIADTGLASRTLATCRRLGVQFALDDFGTGYSSLSYFRRLPVDTLKIDQSFVRGMLEDPEDLGIVESVVRLAQAFNRSVIAEGVETHEHCAVLARLRCHAGQGFGIARPMPAEQLQDWIEHWRTQRKWLDFAEIPLPKKPRDMVLRTAIESHRLWVDSVAEHLRDPDRHAEPPLHSHQCRFGIWYHGSGTVRYGQRAEFVALDDLHEDIHALAAELSRLAGGGQRNEALDRLGELYILRDHFVAAIGQLIAALGVDEAV